MIRRIARRAFQVSLTFIIFGFIDNFIMVLAGDAIDKNITAALGFSAILAAGLGNTISDAMGIFIGRWIDHRLPKNEDVDEVSKRFIICAETIGVVIGCLLGLIPLIWL